MEDVIPSPILRRYELYLKMEKGFSGNTLDAYLRDLRKLTDYLRKENIDFRQPTVEQLDLFAGSLLDKGISGKSVARILAGVRSFYRFLLL